MYLRKYIKILLPSVVIVNFAYFLIWILHSNSTRYRNLEILGNGLQTVTKHTLHMDVTQKQDTEDDHVTGKSKSEHRYESDITLSPDVNRMLDINATNLKVPSISDMHFLLENKQICNVKNLTVFIMIHSAPTHFGHRKAIRETWANAHRLSPLVVIRTVFLFGRPRNSTLQILLEKEFMDFGDIVQGDFEDGYHNLSLNSLFGLKWASENCANAKLIVKSDDDIVVNLNMFLQLVKKRQIMDKTKQVMCFRCAAPVYRNKTDRFYAGENLFKGMNITPFFCEGKFVMITRDVIQYLLKSASLTPMFWIEDVYMYGLVMLNIPNLNFTQINWFHEIEPYRENAKKCLRSKRKCEFFITWADNANEIRDVWSVMELYDEMTDRVASNESKMIGGNVLVEIQNGKNNKVSVN